MTAAGPDLSRAAAALVDPWRAAWPDALGAWGRTTRMHAPRLHTGPVPAVPSFAWYDSSTVEVNVDLAQVARLGLEDHAVAVLAHEVGHHVLAPADGRTRVRIAARVRAGLVDRDDLVPLVANLWCDLLINDRLQRTGGADLVAVWRALGGASDPVMALVLRACELLWGRPRYELCGTAVPVREDAAWLCSRLVRAYARDPVAGSGGFAALVRTSLATDLPETGEGALAGARSLACGDEAPLDGVPYGVADDDSLGADVLHPALDPAVVGDAADVGDAGAPGDGSAPGAADAGTPQHGSGRADGRGAPHSGILPPELHATLAALGSSATLEDVAVAWYRERAAPHLVPFRRAARPGVPDPLLGGLEPWSLGEDVADVDWVGTVTASPVVVPGVTTVRRHVMDDEPVEPRREPVDLDLYLDSSGSMKDPRQFSWVALAGAVLVLSALRAGARVQATTWSGPHQVAGTGGFTRDADAALRAVVAYFGGGTSFPLWLLRRTYLGEGTSRPTARRPTHIAVVSDDGARSMVPDVGSGMERDVATRAVQAAGGGGSLLLDVPAGAVPRLQQWLPEGYDVHSVTGDAALVEFARRFARTTWGEGR
ncbi:hypothetical protein [Cellulomonas wangsupingiae]|uniref:VWA domain-containing protein n=1 Tax=Cellulomonas wangsupingiae TaxID=2968085 RepID=A0ABY5KDN6_9CELL|nr:hypothetical protein [Cellulomonas wangsupingiae]MCC2335348.1 hypothetical protein [Cellulomonas wangsupingiae]UUI66518.1 hypothetical protein NP075_07370 [Cellulomonas wangsupingiae]